MATEHIWTIEKWKCRLPDSRRSGLCLRAEKGVDPDLAQSCKRFARWLRQEYHFPLRVVVYLKAAPSLLAKDGEKAYGLFFEPFSFDSEPHIRIAAGFYPALQQKQGRDNATATVLHCVAHELTHYFQWINGLTLTEIGQERQATRYADCILYEYAGTREHP